MRSSVLVLRLRHSRPMNRASLGFPSLRLVTVSLALIWLAGCTVVLPPPPGLDHPANPKAAEAPVSPTSSTLSPAIPEVPPGPATDVEAPHDHGSMQHPGSPASPPAVPEPTSQPGATPQPAAAGLRYRCPMHPEVQSDEPGRCPRCGMKLEEKGAP